MEGIVTSVLPFRDNDQIVSVFTVEEGRIKVIQKGVLPLGKKSKVAAVPLMRAEFTLVSNKSDLYVCQEVSPIDTYPRLRETFDTLEAAIDLLQIIQDSQPLAQPSPEVYLLLAIFLEKLPSAKFPRAISTSFRLKVMNKEGGLLLSPSCSSCHKGTPTLFLCSGECYCEQHALSQAIPFQLEEIDKLVFLLRSLEFSKVGNKDVDDLLYKKVKNIFEQQFT